MRTPTKWNPRKERMELSPVLQLQIGAATAGAGAAGGGGTNTTPKSVSQQRRSITSMVFMPGQEYTLLTGGDMDGAVRFWDLRALRKPTSCLVAPAAGGCQPFVAQQGNRRAGAGAGGGEGAGWPVVGSWEGGAGGSGGRRSPGSALKLQQHHNHTPGGGVAAGHAEAKGYTLYHQQKGAAAGSGRRGAGRSKGVVGEAAAQCWMSVVCPANRPQGITSLAVSPLGDLLLVSTSDAAHYVYPINGLSGPPVYTLTGHTVNTYCVKSGFSSDGRQVISGSSNHLVHVWNVSGEGTWGMGDQGGVGGQ